MIAEEYFSNPKEVFSTRLSILKYNLSRPDKSMSNGRLSKPKTLRHCVKINCPAWTTWILNPSVQGTAT